MINGQRERIVVAATDTLESVLERVRASEAAALVLDVDERSPLLVSLQHLHRLDEVAQERDVQVAIASTNSKLLNAAKVFGLAVIDRRVTPPPPTVDLDEANEQTDGSATAGSPPEGAGETAVVEEPDSTFEFVRVRPTGDEDGDGAQPASAPTPGPPATRQRPSRPPARSTETRLDPYGQLYTGGEDEDEDEDFDHDGGDGGGWGARVKPSTPRSARTIRPLERGRRQGPALSTPIPETIVEEEGWEDEAEEESAAGEQPAPRREQGPARAELAAAWASARAWFAARRGAATDQAVDESDDADDGDDEAGAEGDGPGAGWDLPPSPCAIADTAPPGEEGWAAPQDRPGGGRASRVIRPLDPGRARRLVVDAGDFADDAPDWESDGWDERERAGDAPAAQPESHPRRRVALGPLIAGAVIALLLLMIALYILLAGATVTLVARTGSVATTFNVVVGEIDPNSPQGQRTKEQIVVPAKRLIVPVSATASRAATGARSVPDLTAGGPVVLRNASTEAVTVPRGTILTASYGRTYITTEGITVPGGDPFNAGAYGTATVRVGASVPGNGGNADAGVVRGMLPNGIFYNNRDAPIAGGSDRKIPFVTRQDRLAAQAAAEAAARDKGPGAIAAALPAGSIAMPDTTGVGKVATAFSAPEDSDGDAVTATVTGEATALVYLPADIEGSGRAEAERRLAAEAGPGESIVPESVQVAAPQLVEEAPGLLRWPVSGTARTRAAVGGERERARLAEGLARKSDDEARALLQGVPGISFFTVEYRPGWFPARMPPRASRIDIRLPEPR